MIGKTLRIGGQPDTVIGVLPPGMRFPQIALAPKIAFQEPARDALLFEPLTPSERDLNADMGNFNYKAIARLKPGVTLAQANAELEALQKAYTLSAHLPLHFGIALTPLDEGCRVRRERRAVAAVCGGRRGAVDRVRQPGQSATRARRQCRTRDCGARRAGRKPRPTDAVTP